MPIQVDRQKVLKSIDRKIAHDVISDIILDWSSGNESETFSQLESVEDDSSDDDAIRTVAPVQHGEGCDTRKDNYFLNAMVVCDDQRRIRHVFAGFPGSAQNHRVFTNSKLARNSSKYFAGDEYLLANSAYPVSEITVSPYKKPVKDTAENSRFNRLHATARVVAERTIGILKG
ncbi:hypothetical protein RvY_10849 [Ramazzottius varieornatus]|uniref:DDE Tnp4 domain-containing protein n=1 Tax=Ramazzottius varieornatus TaxID=947166 RepID=A0A1D1VE43_RAMVA|nr:hypothetical protein RvY_10849 [Ramazzottius varieornatus]